jgi:outer membrane receptor for ferrienterochelin and colicin
VLGAAPLRAADSTVDSNSAAAFGALDLAQLAAVKVDIASIKSRPIREQPGIVSVIQAGEIRESGARDLTDILQLVPGFGLGQDVNGVVGPSFRGLWAYEGKLQLIVDGVEFNETLYGTTQMGHHLPADAIEEVEIIRGPGSAKYGGTAELAVIRVTTKGAGQNGGYGAITPSFASGQMAMDYTGGFGYTKKDWRVAANVYVGENFRANRRYVAQDGTSFDMTHDSDIESRLVSVGLGWKDLDVRVIYDRYRLEDRINFGEPLPTSEHISFETIATMAKYDWRINDWLMLTPSFTFRQQTPWHGGVTGQTVENVTERYIGELTAVANLSDAATLLAGLRYHRDNAEAKDTSFYLVPPNQFYNNGTSDKVGYDTISPYAQLDWDLSWVNLTVGGRYEHHSAVGGQFVPRLGVTKAWERFHLKALFDQAYRTPSINIINSPVNDEVDPEKTTSYQLEVGYLFDHGISLTENLFYMKINDAIVYSVDPGTLIEGYVNGGTISTYGTELELRWQREKFSSSLAYSLYLLDQNTVATWQSGASHVALGIPTHKVSASGTWRICDGLSWNVNGTLTAGQRASLTTTGQPEELNPEFLLNSFVEYRWKHASLGLGVANLLDEANRVVQPYQGGAAPMFLRGREIFVKLGFEF